MKIDDLLKDIPPGGKSPSNLSIDDILDLCPSFIDAYEVTGKFLYRGIKSVSPDVFIGKPHTARTPRDSGYDVSKIFNEILKDIGIKARRDNSIFVTCDSHQAAEYGDLYIVLPLDTFDFTWSVRHKDIVLGNMDLSKLIDREKAEKLYDEIFEKPLPKTAPYLIHDMLIPDEYMRKDQVGKVFGFLGSNWINQVEIIRNAAKTGVLPSYLYDFADPKNLISWPRLHKEFQLDTTDLESAMTMEHEIWINGYYIALDRSMESALRNKLSAKL